MQSAELWVQSQVHSFKFNTFKVRSSYFIFQNAIPLACCPTSTVPAIARALRSITSTLPGAEPTPSLVTNA